MTKNELILIILGLVKIIMSELLIITPREHEGTDFSEDFLQSLSKEELILKCQDLIQRNNKLQQDLNKNKKSEISLTRKAKPKSKAERKESKQRPIDFSQYNTKRIALRFMYLGWDYHGFASQENTINTIEEQLFIALKKGKLIEDRLTSNYSRCGRTDKGVSAFGQVIALDVRGRKKEEFRVEGAGGWKTEDIPYVKAINRLLPLNIRILAYAYVPKDFDARYSCRTRTYKYFFPASNLDIPLMHEAAQRLLGEKDFRNFCKVDIGNNVNHFIRNVVSFNVRRIENKQSPPDLCEMEITGLAFLWHQVRCMASILIYIGLHHETPEVIDYLLDVEKCPKRPQYGIASEIPLVLYDCAFDGVEWIYEKDSNDQNICRMESFWVEKSVQTAGLKMMIDDLYSRVSDSGPEILPCVTSLLPGYTPNDYKLIKGRAVCGGLDRVLEKQAAKRIKLEQKYLNNDEKEGLDRHLEKQAAKRIKLEQKYVNNNEKGKE